MPIRGRTSLLKIAVIAVLVAATAGLFWPTTHSLLVEWSDTATLTYTHGHLVALICGWLLLRDRAALTLLPTRPDYRAAVVLAVLGVVWLISYRAGLQLVHQVLLPLLGWCAVAAALGLPSARRCAFAFGFLYFAIPVWSVSNLLLQDVTVLAVRALLWVSGIPAHVVDNMVHIPAGVFEIAGGCSGLHFFVVALAIAALYGELHRDTLKARILLLALAAGVAMISNWIRVFTIIVAGHLTDMQHYLVRVDHYNFGWVVFAVAMLLFFLLARRLPASEEAAPAVDSAAPSASSTAVIGGAVVALVALSLGPVWSVASSSAHVATIATATLPTDPGTWQGPFPDQGVWQPAYPGADLLEHGEYRGPVITVSAFVATYSYQRQGKEMVGYDNSLLGDSSFDIAAAHRLAPIGYAVNELELSDERRRPSLLWYYYRVGPRRFTRDLTAQLYYGSASLVAVPVSQLIALRAECHPDCASARSALTEMLRALDAQTAQGTIIARN